MPQISYDELLKTINEVEKKFKGLPEDPVRDELMKNIKSLSSAIHPFNGFTQTAKLTSQDTRREIYGEMQQYLNVLSDENKFGGSTHSTTAKVRDLDELNASAANLQLQLGNLYSIPQFTDGVKNLYTSLSTISSAMSEQVKRNDIHRYVDNIENISKKANNQILAVDDTGKDLLNELNMMAVSIGTYPDNVVNLDDRLAAVKSASTLATFYNDNVLDNDQKELFKDQNKSKELHDGLNEFKNTANVVLNDIKANANDLSERFQGHIDTISGMIEQDWNRRVNEATEGMNREQEQQKAEEDQKIAEKIAGAAPGQQMTSEQLNLQRAIEAEPYQYSQLPYLNNIMDVLGIDGTKPPLMDTSKNPPVPATYSYQKKNGETVTRNLVEELQKLKQSAMKLASETASHYTASNEDVKFLTNKEISSLNDTMSSFESECKSFGNLLNKTGIMPETQEKLNAAQNGVRLTSFALHQTNKYINEYATAHEDGKGMFSMYELHGKMNPTACGKFIQKSEWESGVFAPAFEADLKNGKAMRDGKEIDVRGDHKKFAEQLNEKAKNVNAQINKLTNEQLKPLFALSDEFLVINPVTMEQVKGLNASYKETEKALGDFVKTYEDHYFKKNSDGSLKMKDGEPELKINGPYESERDLYNSMKEMHAAVAEKSRLLGFLCDENNNLKENVSEYDKLPIDQKKAAKEADFFNYVLGCKANLASGTLLPQYLLDDHKSPRVSTVLGMMNNKALIDSNNVLEEKLSNTKWVNGKRSLDHIQDMKNKQLQNATHNKIYQFAENNIEKNKDNFRSIVYGSTKAYVFDENNYIKYTDKEGNAKEFDITNKIEAYQDKILAEDDDLTKTFSPTNDGTFNGGFKNAFTEEEIQAGGPFLEKVVTEINRNMYNAGLCKDAIVKSGDKALPAGYNEGFARALVSQMDTMGMYPNVSMFKDEQRHKYNIPQSNSKADPDRVTPVQLANVQENYNRGFEKYDEKIIDPSMQPKYYTTPKNFRSCTFVRDTGIDMNQKLTYDEAAMNKHFKGKSQQEINQKKKLFEDYIAKNKINIRKDWADPSTSSVRDYKTFYKPEMIKRAADLQVKDYIYGIPKRGTDDIRIEFQTVKNPMGYPEVTVVGISGANSDDKLPLSTGFGEDKDLFDPKNMLIMSESMAHEVERISKGLFTPEEKEMMKKLPKDNIDMMKVRAQKIQEYIELGKKEKYNDVYDEKGNLVPDGIGTKQGVIRVLSDEQFKKINLDNLTMGMNGDSTFADADYTKRYEQPPQNMFDTLAAMPKACHEALKDKEKVIWVAEEPNFERGTQYDVAEFIMKGHMAKVDQIRDVEFNMLEAEHMLKKTMSLGREQAAMYEDRSKEKWYHKLRGDSDEFIDVCQSIEELEQTAFRTQFLKDQEESFTTLGRARYIQSLDKKGKDGKKVCEENERMIKEDQAKRWEKYKKLCADKGVFVPEKRPPVGKDPSIFIEVMEKNEAVCEKIEKYLTENPKPSSDLGKVRRDHMMKIYNKVNHQMKEYAYLTGITTYPIRSCSIGEDGKVKFNNVFKNRYDFETVGVHPMVQEEYKRPYLTSNIADKQKAEEFKKQVDEFNEKREENKLSANDRRYMTEYADVKKNYRPTMNRELISPPKESLEPLYEEPKKVEPKGPVMK